MSGRTNILDSEISYLVYSISECTLEKEEFNIHKESKLNSNKILNLFKYGKFTIRIQKHGHWEISNGPNFGILNSRNHEECPDRNILDRLKARLYLKWHAP